MSPEAEKILKMAIASEAELLCHRTALARRNMKFTSSEHHKYLRTRIVAFCDVLDVMGVDRSDFNWVFNV